MDFLLEQPEWTKIAVYDKYHKRGATEIFHHVQEGRGHIWLGKSAQVLWRG